MSRSWPVLTLVFAVSALGCGKAPEPRPVPTGSTTMTSDLPEGKPALSAEDQALADKQKVCPVGGEDLGSMGIPVKVMIGERAVFLCCEGCRESIEKDPEKYLAKLDAPAEAVPAATSDAAAPTAPPAEAPTAETPAADVPAEPAKP